MGKRKSSAPSRRQGVGVVSASASASSAGSPLKKLKVGGKGGAASASPAASTDVDTDKDTVDVEIDVEILVQATPGGAYCATTCGRRGSMEDRHAELETRSADFFGVFDGHGGAKCAQFCSEKLFNMVLADRKFKRRPSDALRDTFIRADQQWCKEARRKKQPDGTTATVLCVTKQGGKKKDKRYYVANTGDSRTILVKVDGAATPLSEMHSPSLESEKKRIHDMGGTVLFDDIDKIHRVDGILAVSRAIGDYWVKPYVTGEPGVKAYDFSPNDLCVILASDGLWDDVSPEEAGKVAVEYAQDPAGAAKNLVSLAYRRGSEDNICVTVVPLGNYINDK